MLPAPVNVPWCGVGIVAPGNEGVLLRTTPSGDQNVMVQPGCWAFSFV